jgi:hypothetical protein
MPFTAAAMNCAPESAAVEKGLRTVQARRVHVLEEKID